MSNAGKYGRWLALILCLLIMLLAMHAKLALYEQHVNPSSVVSLKMWVEGQKVLTPAVSTFSFFPCLLVFLAVTSVLVRYRRYAPVVPVTQSPQASAFQFYRFLR